jgi:hypothetical protein
MFANQVNDLAIQERTLVFGHLQHNCIGSIFNKLYLLYQQNIRIVNPYPDQLEMWAMNKQLSCGGCGTLHHAANERSRSDTGILNITPWRAALGTLLGAPARLHRYRHLRGEVIEDALRAFGNGPKHGGRS